MIVQLPTHIHTAGYLGRRKDVLLGCVLAVIIPYIYYLVRAVEL